MSIKTTRHITREEAIRRIKDVSAYIAAKDYRGLDGVSFEPDFNVAEFIDTEPRTDISNIESWSDRMLEDKMDAPFFRYSMFDNYLIM